MAFYDLFVRPAYQSAFAIVGNRDEAEEIMQDAMMKVFSETGLIRDDVTEMTRLLRRIAANRAIDAVRRRKDFVTLMDDEPEGSRDAEDGAEADGGGWEVEEIRDGVDRLAPAYRSVIGLRLFEEMSFAEIARQLHVNASTVRVQYTRGIARLRSFLIQKKERDERYA
jgi:RNA polymerase sigma-70 factor (ECF subfamily)